MSDVCKMEGKCVQMLLGFGATHTHTCTHTSLFSLSLSLSCHTLPPYQLSLSLASHLTRAREMCSILTGANIATAASPLFRFLLCCSVLFCSVLLCPVPFASLFVFADVIYLYSLVAHWGVRHPDSGSPPDDRMFDLIN